MLIPHKGHTDTIQVYSVTVMTHVKALQAGHSSQGTSEPITPVDMFLRHSTPRGRRFRTCHRWNYRLMGYDWTSTWMLSICFLCLRCLRDAACIYPFCPLFRHRCRLRRVHNWLRALCMSLSITDHTANLQLLTPPFIPLPDTILVRHIRILSRCRSRFPRLTRCQFRFGRGRLTL